MAEEIRRASAYVESMKVAEMESSDYSENTNGERMHAQDGVLGISTGNPEVELRFNVIRPVNPKGALMKMEEVIAGQQYVTLSYKIGTKIISAAYKCTQRSYSSDSRTGTMKGTFTFMNAENPSEA